MTKEKHEYLPLYIFHTLTVIINVWRYQWGNQSRKTKEDKQYNDQMKRDKKEKQ